RRDRARPAGGDPVPPGEERSLGLATPAQFRRARRTGIADCGLRIAERRGSGARSAPASTSIPHSAIRNPQSAIVMIVIPSIDLRGGRCVRLMQGDFARETVYGDDPVAIARRWQEAGAPRLHVVDLDGAREGRPVQAEIIGEIARALAIPVQAGGGLRTLDDLAARCPGLAILASGGVAAREHLAALAAIPGVEGAIVGRALYTGDLALGPGEWEVTNAERGARNKV